MHWHTVSGLRLAKLGNVAIHHLSFNESQPGTSAIDKAARQQARTLVILALRCEVRYSEPTAVSFRKALASPGAANMTCMCTIVQFHGDVQTVRVRTAHKRTFSVTFLVMVRKASLSTSCDFQAGCRCFLTNSTMACRSTPLVELMDGFQQQN